MPKIETKAWCCTYKTYCFFSVTDRESNRDYINGHAEIVKCNIYAVFKKQARYFAESKEQIEILKEEIQDRNRYGELVRCDIDWRGTRIVAGYCD